MLKKIKEILSSILEGIVAGRHYRATGEIHPSLHTAVDHADLKAKEEKILFNKRGVR